MNISPNLYEELMALTESAAFYFSDQILDGRTYRIFNYRLASYSDFLLPSALNCRGTMFDVSDGDNPILVCLPMHKFFNLNENPFTQNVELDSVKRIAPKSDGSLISTFIHNGELRLKSKGSIDSQQVKDAEEWLNKEENERFKSALEYYTWYGWTVNLEWVSPSNRIVLAYSEPKLIVLNARSRNTGRYLNVEETVLGNYALAPVETESAASFVRGIPDMTENIEGFVCQTINSDGLPLWFKVKTKKYCALHHCKDSISNPRRLFEVILSEGIDDVKSMFWDNEVVMSEIERMEGKVEVLYNGMVAEIERFYETNKGLDRKDYAIKAKSEVTSLYFGLAMNKYVGKIVDYKEFLKSKWEVLEKSLTN